MDEMVEKARALLNGAPVDWVVDSEGGVEVAAMGSDGLPCRRDVAHFYDPSVADLVAFAVNNLGPMCDELESAVGGARAASSVLREVRDTCEAELGPGFRTIETTAMVRILRDRADGFIAETERLRKSLAAAEAERDTLRECLKGEMGRSSHVAGAVLAAGFKWKLDERGGLAETLPEFVARALGSLKARKAERCPHCAGDGSLGVSVMPCQKCGGSGAVIVEGAV